MNVRLGLISATSTPPVSVVGSFFCTCDAGYSGDGVTCSDIDEARPTSTTAMSMPLARMLSAPSTANATQATLAMA